MKKSINFTKNEYSRIDTTLIDKIKILADKERKIKEYKRKLPIFNAKEETKAIATRKIEWLLLHKH